MNFTEIKQVLQGIYGKALAEGKKRHIVFWYDEDSEFVNDMDELQLETTKLIKLKQKSLTAQGNWKRQDWHLTGTISITTKDYLMHIQDIHGIGLTSELSLAAE